MECTPKEGSAVIKEYENEANVTATGALSNISVTDSDFSHYIVDTNPKIDIEKHTNGEDADNPTGPYIEVGKSVTWKYIVKNINITKPGRYILQIRAQKGDAVGFKEIPAYLAK